MQRAPVKSLLLLALAAMACNTTPNLSTTSFDGPSGLVVAGLESQYLFVANTGIDTLQVVKLGDGIANIDMLASPARYFPLNIPAGPSPTELAATFDGHYVLVLNPVTSSIRVLDANTLTLVQNPNGSPLDFLLSSGDAQPSGMVGSPVACDFGAGSADTCLGRAYVAMRRLGAIAAVDVRKSPAGVVSVTVDGFIAVNGSPWRLATHPNQPYVYATDAANPDLIRINVQTGLVDRTPIGAIGGPVVASSDGNFVVVGRPDLRDVLILASNSGDGGPLVVQDANPVLIPAPACVQSCFDASAKSCQGAHVADLSVCASSTGLATGPMPAYGAVYLGRVPGRLATLGNQLTAQVLQEKCAQTNGETLVNAYNESVAIATLEGSISFLGLSDDKGNPNFHLIETSSCRSPSLLTASATFPTEYLAPCVDMPAGRAAFACTGDPNDPGAAAGGVVSLVRGHASGQQWRFAWEGIYPGFDRSSAASGAIDVAGNFYDAQAAFTGLSVQTQTANGFGGVGQPGDILEITTAPTPACMAALNTSNASPCILERRIVAIGPDSANPTSITLDAPYPAACAGVGYGYRIRAGDAFLVSANDGNNTPIIGPSRVGMGAGYGLGFPQGDGQSVTFRVAPGLRSASQVPACDRYIGGNPNQSAGMAPFLSRNTPLGFSIQDPFQLAQTGTNFASNGVPVGQVGSLPSGMVVTRPTASNPSMLMVSYSGTDALVVSVPFDTSNLTSTNYTYKVLQ